MELAEIQRRGKRVFIFEHPWLSMSWKLDSVREMWGKVDVDDALFDMCSYGMFSRDEGRSSSSQNDENIIE